MWNISKWACPNRSAIEHTCMCAVNHAQFKTTKINFQGILVNYAKICTNEISRYTVYWLQKVWQGTKT